METISPEVLAPQVAKTADEYAREITEAVSNDPQDMASVERRLYDLKFAVAKYGVELAQTEGRFLSRQSDEYVWRLAEALPEFSVDALYQKRASLLSCGAAVVLGWFLGGLVSTLLGFIGLGGEILRPLAIFGVLVLLEYLSVHPGARKIILAIFGMGALARFAGMLSAGIFRFTGFASFRQAIFGGARFNIFKSAWLVFGGAVLFVFFAKKITGLDFGAFSESLRKQIEQRINLVVFVTLELDGVCGRTSEPENDILKNGQCPKSDCQLAQAVLDMLDGLDEGRRKYLLSQLNKLGYTRQDNQSDYLVWNDDEHASNYEPIGMVANGDLCRILKHPLEKDGKTIRGHVQRVNS